MLAEIASTVLDRMLDICMHVPKAKWFPPTGFNLVAWAAACSCNEDTIENWANQTGAPIYRRPGGPKGERYIAIEDFWPALEAYEAGRKLNG